MNEYEVIAQTLAKLRAAAGGTRDQQLATASLLQARLFYECVELCRALKREDFEVNVYEDHSHFTLRMNGTWLRVTRFSGQTELALEFTGFDPRLVPADSLVQRHEIGALGLERISELAQETIRALGNLWREEVALRASARR